MEFNRAKSSSKWFDNCPLASTIKQKTNTPERGFCFKVTGESLLSKGCRKNKKYHAQHGVCFLFAGLEVRGSPIADY